MTKNIGYTLNTLRNVYLVIVKYTNKNIIKDLPTFTNHTNLRQKTILGRILHREMESMPTVSASTG